ncbi:hypothetical protein [uncultured Anaerococcus sp.]|uniref:hypothetical protein n=1 Tax=uncultured Anaerococcus sp. TaxID=293428 RepID=UPI0025EBD2A5|nr:hypothetical protein [uncultured Anaerococcus sp.]
MEYKEIRNFLEEKSKTNYKDLIKAIISLESPQTSEDKLKEVYNYYMDNDGVFLLSDELRKRL